MKQENEILAMIEKIGAVELNSQCLLGTGTESKDVLICVHRSRKDFNRLSPQTEQPQSRISRALKRLARMGAGDSDPSIAANCGEHATSTR